MIKRFALYSLIGSIGYSGSIWALNIVISRGYGVEALGDFTLYQGIITPIMLLLSFNLKQFVPADSNNRWSDGDIIAFRLASIFLICVASVAAVYLLRDNIGLLFFSVLFLKAIESLSDASYAVKFRKEHHFQVMLSKISKGIVLLLPIIILQNQNFSDVIFISAILMVLITIAYDMPKLTFRDFRLTGFFSIIYMALPLAISSFIDSLLINLPRYFLGDNSLYLGQYAIVISFITAAGIVISSIGIAILPRIAHQLVKNKPSLAIAVYFKSLLSTLLVLSIPYLLVYFYFDELTDLLYHEKIVNSNLYSILVPSIVFCWTLSGINGCFLIAAKKFKSHLATYCLSISVLILLYLTMSYLLEYEDDLLISLSSYASAVIMRAIFSTILIYKYIISIKE